MNINPSSTPIVRNQQDSLKTEAQQMVMDTERSFARILGQLLTDGEQPNSLSANTFLDSIPVKSGLSNLTNSSFMPNYIPMPNTVDYLSSAPLHRIEYTNQASSSKINSDRLDSILGGRLKGTGQWFISAGNQYGVDPALLASISMHETGNGTSKAARERNNISGTMTSSGLKNYESIQQSIMDMARNLRENYLNKGLHTIEEIGRKYAPVGADNDPTNLNQYWVRQVSKNYNSIST